MICELCKKEIDIKNGKYTHVEDYNCELLENDSWFHLVCFQGAMNRSLNNLEKAAAIMLKKSFNVFNNLPDELKQERHSI